MSRGGSRHGAGRPGWRAKVQHLRALRVAGLARGGYLRPSVAFTWEWWREGALVASIGARVDDAGTSLRLAYTLRGDSGHEGERRECVQHVPLLRTPCHFGGSRHWFACPVCRRRVGLLVFRAGRFACRHCQRASYASQSEDALGRNWRKQSRLEARLGDDWARPKGMRRKTYERLLDGLAELEAQRDAALWAFMAKNF
jgi:hypothetical protein